MSVYVSWLEDLQCKRVVSSYIVTYICLESDISIHDEVFERAVNCANLWLTSYQKASVMQQYVPRQDQAHECNPVPAHQAKSVLSRWKNLNCRFHNNIHKMLHWIQSLNIALGMKPQDNLRLTGTWTNVNGSTYLRCRMWFYLLSSLLWYILQARH